MPLKIRAAVGGGGMRRPVGALPLLSLVPTPAAWLPAWNQSRRADTAKSGTFRSAAIAVPSAYLGLGRKRRRVFQSVLSPGSKSKRRQGGPGWVGQCGIFLLRGSERQRGTACQHREGGIRVREIWLLRPPAWKHTNTFIIFFVVFFFPL